MPSADTNHRHLAITFAVAMLALVLVVIMRSKCGHKEADAENFISGMPYFPNYPKTHLTVPGTVCNRNTRSRCNGWSESAQAAGPLDHACEDRMR
jgi:hypothetical protein